MIKVLVFPCGSEIGLEIHAALKYAKDIELYGASSTSDHGEFIYRRYRQIDADAHSAELPRVLEGLIREWGIDIILPAHDNVMLRLAEIRAELDVALAVPTLEVANICRNKNLTYDFFAHRRWVPARFSGLADSYPIFAKPAVGQGSQGVELVQDPEHHQVLLSARTEYVFCEYLPGPEYTVDCISDATGKLLRAMVRERARIKSGISVRTQPVTGEAEFVEIATDIAETLQIKGAWFFQLKRDASQNLRLLEVAPRIAGSMGLSRNLGVNFPLLSIYAYLNKPFMVLPQTHWVQVDRALKSCFKTDIEYRHVYLDLDDTLIIREAVNTTLVALLYQWLAKSIPVTLVTRHNSCPKATLDAYRICPDLFAEIIHISDGSPKSAVIKDGVPALFIDDSFSERLEVSQNAGIPVFDVDAVEQLLDWSA